jgi:hypothetical protein
VHAFAFQLDAYAGGPACATPPGPALSALLASKPILCPLGLHTCPECDRASECVALWVNLNGPFTVRDRIAVNVLFPSLAR